MNRRVIHPEYQEDGLFGPRPMGYDYHSQLVDRSVRRTVCV